MRKDYSAEPYADAGSDDGHDKIRYRSVRGHSDQAEHQAADKTANNSKKDVLNPRCLGFPSLRHNLALYFVQIQAYTITIRRKSCLGLPSYFVNRKHVLFEK